MNELLGVTTGDFANIDFVDLIDPNVDTDIAPSRLAGTYVRGGGSIEDEL